jgi:hypothetical protein
MRYFSLQLLALSRWFPYSARSVGSAAREIPEKNAGMRLLFPFLFVKCHEIDECGGGGLYPIGQIERLDAGCRTSALLASSKRIM